MDQSEKDDAQERAAPQPMTEAMREQWAMAMHALRQRDRVLEVLAPVLDHEGIERDEGTLDRVAKSLLDDFHEQQKFQADIATVIASEALDPEAMTWERLGQLINDLRERQRKAESRALDAEGRLALLSGLDEQYTNLSRRSDAQALIAVAALEKVLARPHRVLSAFGPDVHEELKAVFKEFGGDVGALPGPEVDARLEKAEADAR